MRKRFSFFICVSFLLFLISACGDEGNIQANTGATDPLLPTFTQVAHTTHTVLAQGRFAEYALPQNHSSLMRPALDHKGRIWFGEMGRNYLAYFDPSTQRFQQMTPPHGADGIMGIAVATDDTIWFAEQYANYIGHYIPTTGQYRIYNLPVLHKTDPGNPTKTLALPVAPNDLVLDQQGNVWFTEMNADAIGVLHSKTGQITQYFISSPHTIQVLNPYGITIDPQGSIWFTEASSEHLGRLDPKTGIINYYTSPDITAPLMEIASDTHGIIWTTAFDGGLLLKFTPTTGQFSAYIAPANGTNAGGLYGLSISPTDDVWVTIMSANAIAHLDSKTQQFQYYQIPSSDSLPLGLVIDAQHTIWFTESATDKIGNLKV